LGEKIKSSALNVAYPAVGYIRSLA